MTTPAKIFRFKLSASIMEDITEFARIHQYDDRHTYKTAWLRWVNEHTEFIEREVNRLTELHYTGDVLDKMFKAGRYYFREKVITHQKAAAAAAAETAETAAETATAADTAETATAAAKEKKIRTYILLEKNIIQAMDTHLSTIIHTPGFKPADGYQKFCAQHLELLRLEMIRLKNEHNTADVALLTAKICAEKIKKTYKNRYFILTKQISKN